MTENEKRKRLENMDEESRKRGKRLFGVLMTTLTGEKQRLETRTDAMLKRQEIEAKLLERIKQEKKEAQERISKEAELKKQQLIQSRAEMDQKRMQELKETITRDIKCIFTKSKPFIGYCPAKWNDRTRELLEESRGRLSEQTSTICEKLDEIYKAETV